MKMNNRLISTGATLFLALGLSACEQPGVAENTGKKIDQQVENAGQQIDNAGEKMKDSVDKMADKLEEKSDQAKMALEDTEITAKVKAAIFAEPSLKSLQIAVVTVNGDVTLSGSVASASLGDLAKGLAEAVDDVKHVNNHIVIK
ncbi:MAG: BON domain-containing protein [Gallionellaceae bacterium]|jgi:osmotically-inducible protein OsmY